ncbi:hypothetical protein SteCoe_34672 [Stentor coeruleus]|uniref:Uncharacterized protein n=1 Tax=Stentor coeruleus TaxID=5963 RepID=A0A1R2AU06_9CILI|nr:hypothetical protein SteCoe_34672 [Stentor coeruleus]
MGLRSIRSRKPQQREKLQKSVNKGLKAFEPRCASRNPSVKISENIDKEIRSIVKVQEKFYEDRKKLRLGLHNIPYYKEKLLTCKTPDLKNSNMNKEKILNKLTVTKLWGQGHSLSPSTPRTCRACRTPKHNSDIDNFINTCEEFKAESNKLSKNLPTVGKFFRLSYIKIKEVVQRLEEKSSEYSGYYRDVRIMNKNLREFATSR